MSERQVLTEEQAQYLMDNGLRRVLRKDPAAPHQIVMLPRPAGLIAVSCNCKRTRGDGWSLSNSSYDVIEARRCRQPGEAIARWREHLGEAGEATA